jgi:small subunit ribosomal protein S19e
VYLKPTIGVGALRHKYGGAKRRGTKPSHHNNSSGAIVRNALQGLETLGFVEKTGSGGRQITQKGQRELDRIASRVSKPVPPIGF